MYAIIDGNENEELLADNVLDELLFIFCDRDHSLSHQHDLAIQDYFTHEPGVDIPSLVRMVSCYCRLVILPIRFHRENNDRNGYALIYPLINIYIYIYIARSIGQSALF